jgi:predicted nucleic acid-binding protein
LSETPRIYLDANVYSRPFDDQEHSSIREESDAFLWLISEVRGERLKLLSSDILMFEIANILGEEKSTKIRPYLELCSGHIENTNEILELGRTIQDKCRLKARDALHVSSAILGTVRYFLSCDAKVTQMKQAQCYRSIAKSHRHTYFSAMNPVRFTEKMKKGEIT